MGEGQPTAVEGQPMAVGANRRWLEGNRWRLEDKRRRLKVDVLQKSNKQTTKPLVRQTTLVTCPAEEE